MLDKYELETEKKGHQRWETVEASKLVKKNTQKKHPPHKHEGVSSIPRIHLKTQIW